MKHSDTIPDALASLAAYAIRTDGGNFQIEGYSIDRVITYANQVMVYMTDSKGMQMKFLLKVKAL